VNWLRVSLYAQALLAAYFQAVQWLPLGKWNYQPGFSPLLLQAGRGLTLQDVLLVGLFALPLAIFWLAFAKRLRWLMAIGLVFYSVWLALEIKTWWVSYALGASDSWAAVYQRVFSQSTQLLPSFGRHLPPDGLHIVLQILLAASVASGVAGFWKRAPREQLA
jgi:hypothetical protein